MVFARKYSIERDIDVRSVAVGNGPSEWTGSAHSAFSTCALGDAVAAVRCHYAARRQAAGRDDLDADARDCWLGCIGRDERMRWQQHGRPTNTNLHDDRNRYFWHTLAFLNIDSYC